MRHAQELILNNLGDAESIDLKQVDQYLNKTIKEWERRRLDANDDIESKRRELELSLPISTT